MDFAVRWAHEWLHEWVHEWAHESAHESSSPSRTSHESSNETPHELDFFAKKSAIAREFLLELEFFFETLLAIVTSGWRTAIARALPSEHS